MSKRITKLFLTLTGVFGLTQAFATDIYPFFLQRQDGTLLECYFSPPSARGAPIIFAIQGSSCESVLEWHKSLSDRASALGLGVIALEKQGVSREGINLLAYSQTNCLQNRLEDYVVCLENAQFICPEWEGKPIFWGESEGGMLAAILAGQTPQTAAVLLFGAGGGMKPREEVKWALQHHLEKQGAMQDEIDQYMCFLDEQMDAMILDPTSEKQFLGNTYKWWAFFLTAEEGAMPLSQQSLPICLVHGVEDVQIPVQSADLAAEMLSKTNVLTYLRLEGYGHDVDIATVQNAVCHWLEAVLMGNTPVNDILIAQAEFATVAPVKDAQAGTFEYVFSRGKRDNGESHGDVYGSARIDRDSEGNQRGSVDVGAKHDFGNGLSLDARVGASESRDKEGNSRGEVHAEGSANFRC